MSIPSRRKKDLRQDWLEDNLSDDEALIMPPCELWHGANEKNNDIQMDNGLESFIGKEDTYKASKTTHIKPQCWAFMGAVGGVGTTTLAVQMAYEIAKKQSALKRNSQGVIEPQVCLVDLDFESGASLHHLELEPGLSSEDLSDDIKRIDATYVESLLTRHSSGINVLAAPNIIGANADVNPQNVLALLDTVCEMFPYVIIDLPRQWQSWSLPAVVGSDFFGLLTDLTIPSLQIARMKRLQIEEMNNNDTQCQIILSKYERRSFRNTLRLSDAKIALQGEVFGTLCADPDVTREALNCGQPVGSIKADSRYGKDCRKLFAQIFSTIDIPSSVKPSGAVVAA